MSVATTQSNPLGFTKVVGFAVLYRCGLRATNADRGWILLSYYTRLDWICFDVL